MISVSDTNPCSGICVSLVVIVRWPVKRAPVQRGPRLLCKNRDKGVLLVRHKLCGRQSNNHLGAFKYACTLSLIHNGHPEFELMLATEKLAEKLANVRQ